MNVYGYFYKRTINNLTINCRNILILSTSKIKNINTFKADVLIVMMNPGDSKPNNENNIQAICNSNELFQKFTSIYETIADKTQEAIIELMGKVDYNNAIIINISDIRDKDSESFKRNIKNKDFKNAGSVHSIFDNQRHKELEFILKKSENKPIIIATGVDYKLRFLVEQAMNKLPINHIVGFKKLDTNRYFHPSRMKNKWICEVIEQLRNKGYLKEC